MKSRRRNTVCLLFTAFVFSLYCTLPYFGAVSLAGVCLRFFLYFAVCAAASLFLCRIFGRLLPAIHCETIEEVLYEKWPAGKYCLLLWGIQLLAWIPAYLAFFPGIFGYDAPDQMRQILGEIPYSSHHPVAHTLILGAFMKCGNALFGTYNGGVALFCIFQGLTVSGSIAYSFLLMRRLRTPFPVLAIGLAWCAFHPALQVLTFNTTKDILFGVVMLHFMLQCYGWFAEPANRERRRTVLFILTGVLMCLLRNQGIYIVLALVVFGVFAFRKEKRFLVSLCAIVLFSRLFFLTAEHGFGVQKGDAREMLSVPMQQMALVCRLYMEGESVSLTKEEFEAFSRLVDKQYIPEHQLLTADPVKNHFDTEELKSDLPGYLRLYVRVGMRNPGLYLAAFRYLVYPYWDMSENAASGISINNTFPEFSRAWGISQETLFPSYKAYLVHYMEHGIHEKMPVVSWLMQPGLCIWILTALFGASAAGKDKAAFTAAMIGMLFFMTLLLGPTALVRYLYPLMIAAPCFLAMLCGEMRMDKEGWR